MKRILCLLLCIGMILTLSSCWWRKNPNPTENTTPSGQTPTTGVPTTGPADVTETTEATDPPIQLPPLPMVSVSLPLIHETTYASDGTEVFRYSFQDVALNITDADVTQIITLDLLQRMDSSAKDIADLEAQALREYTAGSDWTAYYYEVIYTPSRIDETVLSLHGTHRSYNGKAHPTASMASATYDLVTGKYLGLSDILLSSDGSADAMCAALIAELDKIARDKNLFAGYDATIQSSFSVDLNRYYAWYFTENGICFYFLPYEIAPNSAGTIEVTVPYSRLTGILKDDYFPVEQPDIAGTLSAGWFDKADLSQFTHFSEVIDKPDARRSILWVDTVIYNVRLEQGHWDAAENKFVANSTVFTSNCIAEGDALTLRCELSDTTPTLLLHYVSDGKAQSCYITKNHTTGAVVLTPIS